ncbi:MAG TPA: hypothetical protein VKS79_14395 [Gemmataceae bacterium]|nr:hypothetical protein [Gemmataceae bacterium]
MIELTKEQREAATEHPNDPLELVDPETLQTYVLLRKDRYRQLEQRDNDEAVAAVREAYPLMDEIAAKAGWADPAMDIYDDLAAKDGT